MKKTIIAAALLAVSFIADAALPLPAIMSHDNHAAEWKPNIAYVAGSIGSYQGQQYRTKWWSQNTPPQNTNWSSWQRADTIPDGDYTLKLKTGHASRVDWDGVQEVLTRLRDQLFTESAKQEIYDTFAKSTGDHTQLKLWQDDTRFVMVELAKLNADRSSVFSKRLDLSRIGMLGTSYVGTTSVQYLSAIDNPSIRAAANIDGQENYLIVKHQFNKPVLLLSTESWVSTDLDLAYDTAGNDAYRLHVKGSLHGDIGDGMLLYSNGITPYPAAIVGSIPAQTMLDITNKSVLAFFDQYVKCQPQIHKNALEFLKDYREAEVRFICGNRPQHTGTRAFKRTVPL